LGFFINPNFGILENENLSEFGGFKLGLVEVRAVRVFTFGGYGDVNLLGV
jgi:hypothetical protein